MDRFNDYINENVAPNKDLPQDWVYGHLDVRFILRQKNCAVLEICMGEGQQPSVCTGARGAVPQNFGGLLGAKMQGLELSGNSFQYINVFKNQFCKLCVK